MREEIRPCIFLVIVGLLLSAGCKTKSNKKREEASAHNSIDNEIKLTGAWARPGSKGGNSAVYLKISNSTSSTDTLLSVSTSAAQKASVHESYQKNGMSGMRPAGKQAIEPDSTFKLQPGGFHIMLMRLKQKLIIHDSLQLNLTFSSGEIYHLTVPVKNNGL